MREGIPQNPNHHHPEVAKDRRRRERSRRRLAEQAAAPGGCIWTGCPKQPGKSYPSLPLCDAHVTVVVEQATAEDRRQRAECAARMQARADALNVERQTRPGWIYYLQVGDHIKIGYASSLTARLMAYPPTSSLLATHRGTLDDESALHRRFRQFLAAGREWYELAPPLLQHIAAVVAEHGTPSSDPFEARRSSGRLKTGSLSGPGPRLRSRSTRSGWPVI